MKIILEQAGIPLLLFVICMYYGFRMIMMQDSGAIRGKSDEPLKNEKEYARCGGILILALGGASLVMAILMLINVYAAVAEIIICAIVIGFLWEKMNDKYGV